MYIGTHTVTNASGAVVERNLYEPFGKSLSGASSVRYGYESKEADSVVGDTDFNARKYKADWGVFLQPDSVLPDVYDPQQLNRYAFERNNPYSYVDDDGHSSVLFHEKLDEFNAKVEYYKSLVRYGFDNSPAYVKEPAYVAASLAEPYIDVAEAVTNAAMYSEGSVVGPTEQEVIQSAKDGLVALPQIVPGAGSLGAASDLLGAYAITSFALSYSEKSEIVPETFSFTVPTVLTNGNNYNQEYIEEEDEEDEEEE